VCKDAVHREGIKITCVTEQVVACVSTLPVGLVHHCVRGKVQFGSTSRQQSGLTAVVRPFVEFAEGRLPMADPRHRTPGKRVRPGLLEIER